MSTTHKHIFSALLVALCVFVSVSVAHAFITVTTSGTVTITAQVGPTPTTPTTPTNPTTPTTPSSPGGGGSSSSSSSTAPATGLPTTVNFSGMAYPSSPVVILKDGVIVATTVADPSASFSASLTNLVQGSYTFSVYTVDAQSLHSISFSFPVYVTNGATINIGDIILAPTINLDKTVVKHGDPVTIFGYSVPNSTVTIAIHSDVEQLLTTTAGKTGAYLYTYDTTPLEYGSHEAQSHATIDDKISATTNDVSFTVADENKAKPTGCSTVIADLNCDKKVNLVDFSIMAYWYKKATTPPPIVDLNNDGKINLIDFSILAYHWSG